MSTAFLGRLGPNKETFRSGMKLARERLLEFSVTVPRIHYASFGRECARIHLQVNALAGEFAIRVGNGIRGNRSRHVRPPFINPGNFGRMTRCSEVFLNRLAPRIIAGAEGSVHSKGMVLTDNLADHPA